MFPYQPTHQLTTAGSIKDLKYPNFDLTNTNDFASAASKTVRAFENLTLPASFLASYPGGPSSLLAKPSAPVGSNGQPVKGLYIIDQNKNIRKLTLPANPPPPLPATSTGSFSSSSSSSNLSPQSSASSAPTTPLGFDQAATNASLLLSSLIQSTTPTKHGAASYVPAQFAADLYAAGTMLNVVRKRRKQDLSAPVLTTTGPSSSKAAPATVLYPAMTDLTNSNGPFSHLLSSSSSAHLHHVAALKQFQHSMSMTSTMNGQHADCVHLEPVSPAAGIDLMTNDASYLSPLLLAAENDSTTTTLDDETVKSLSKEFRYVASNGLSWSAKKCKTHVAIAKSYKPTWKSRSHHYQRYSDIKAKDSTGRSVSSITTRELDESLNEWKLHYVIGQVNSLMSYETESMSLMSDVEAMIESMKDYEAANRDLFDKLHDSIKANHMRHRYVNEQLEEAHLLIHKLFEHKDKFKNVLVESAQSTADQHQHDSSTPNADLDAEDDCKLSSVGHRANNSLRKNLKKSINTRTSLTSTGAGKSKRPS